MRQQLPKIQGSLIKDEVFNYLLHLSEQKIKTDVKMLYAPPNLDCPQENEGGCGVQIAEGKYCGCVLKEENKFCNFHEKEFIRLNRIKNKYKTIFSQEIDVLERIPIDKLLLYLSIYMETRVKISIGFYHTNIDLGHITAMDFDFSKLLEYITWKLKQREKKGNSYNLHIEGDELSDLMNDIDLNVDNPKSTKRKLKKEEKTQEKTQKIFNDKKNLIEDIIVGQITEENLLIDREIKISLYELTYDNVPVDSNGKLRGLWDKIEEPGVENTVPIRSGTIRALGNIPIYHKSSFIAEDQVSKLLEHGVVSVKSAFLKHNSNPRWDYLPASLTTNRISNEFDYTSGHITLRNENVKWMLVLGMEAYIEAESALLIANCGNIGIISNVYVGNEKYKDLDEFTCGFSGFPDIEGFDELEAGYAVIDHLFFEIQMKISAEKNELKKKKLLELYRKNGIERIEYRSIVAKYILEKLQKSSYAFVRPGQLASLALDEILNELFRNKYGFITGRKAKVMHFEKYESELYMNTIFPFITSEQFLTLISDALSDGVQKDPTKTNIVNFSLKLYDIETSRHNKYVPGTIGKLIRNKKGDTAELLTILNATSKSLESTDPGKARHIRELVRRVYSYTTGEVKRGILNYLHDYGLRG